MLFLCLDTATPTARVAVLDHGGAVLFAAEATADRHSGHVLALVARALAAAGTAPAALGGIACGGGPGSFTGLRVGLAVAKGLALPTGVPLHVVSSLQALALDLVGALGPEITAVPCLDAGKGEIHVAAYTTDGDRLVREVRPACRLAPAALAPWLDDLPRPAVGGNGAERYRAALGLTVSAVAGPTAVSVGRLALLEHARGEAADLEHAVPFYGRAPDITVKNPKPRS